jgi:hypothetical protein
MDREDTLEIDLEAPTEKREPAIFTNWNAAARTARVLTDRAVARLFVVQHDRDEHGRRFIIHIFDTEGGRKVSLGVLQERDFRRHLISHFQVGDGVHYSHPSDVYPATVRKVSKSGHMIWVSSDRVAKAEWDESFGPRARLYEPREVPESEWKCFTRRADGEYRAKGHTSPVLGYGRDFNQPREI